MAVIVEDLDQACGDAPGQRDWTIDGPDAAAAIAPDAMPQT